MSKRILLADDSAATRTSVEKALGPDDYQLVTAENGQAAMDLIHEALPHLVLAHALLPGISGYEICRQVKENPETSHIPVLLLTGTFEPFDINQAKEVHYDGFVTKPPDQQELKSLIGRSIAKAVYPAVEPVAEEATPEPVAEVSDFPGSTDEAVADHGSDAMLDRIFPDDQPLEEVESGDQDGEDLFAIVDPDGDTGETAETGFGETVDRRSPDFGIWGSPGTADEDEPAVAEEITVEAETASTEDSATTSEDSDLSWFLKKYEEKSRAGESSAEEPQEEKPEEEFHTTFIETGAQTIGTAQPASDPDLTDTFLSPALEEEAAVEKTPEGMEVAVESDSLMESVEPLPVADEYEAVQQPSASPVLLDDQQLEQIARRVVELLSDSVVRDVAWEAVPEIAERLIRERLRDIETEADSTT